MTAVHRPEGEKQWRQGKWMLKLYYLQLGEEGKFGNLFFKHYEHIVSLI